jgi:quercetin dioxygenase-like cupin family protein
MSIRGSEATMSFAGDGGDAKRLTPTVFLRASGRQTGDRFELFEVRGTFAPPPHVHRGLDELFYVIDGAIELLLADDRIDARAGSLIYASRGTRHGVTAGPDGHLLVLVTPPGLAGFFEEFGAGLAAGMSPPEIVHALGGKYDNEVVP